MTIIKYNNKKKKKNDKKKIIRRRRRRIIIQVEPGKPGAEVSKKKYKSKKEFAYRMCTG